MNKKNHNQENRSKLIKPSLRVERDKQVSHQGNSPVMGRDLTWDTQVGQHKSVPSVQEELGAPSKKALETYWMMQATWDKDRVSHACVPDENQVTKYDLPDLGHNETNPPREDE